jgi:CBS domain-containing protein
MILEEFIEFLKKVPPFQFLDEGTLKNIAGNVSMEFHPQGTTILSQGGPAPDSLYIIKKGVVKVSIKNAEEEVFVDYRGEGDLIGYLLIFEGATSRATVSTVDDTIFYLVKRDTIKNLLYTNPKVREFFHKSFLAKYLDRTFKEIENRNLSYSCGDRILFTIRVGELAAKEVITASQDLSIQDAAEIMSVKRISCLILVDNENIPAGIVTDRDLRDKVVSKGKDLSTPVNEIL